MPHDKRSHPADDQYHYRPQKKQHRDYDHRNYSNHHHQQHRRQGHPEKKSLPPAKPSVVVDPARLPPLPTLSPQYSSAPFTHRSVTGESRSISASNALSYERLEFIGDAYLELFASRLIFDRYPHLPTGQMSQLREMLVKNETLAEFSRAYTFDTRVNVADMERMKADAAQRGNKGYNKVLGDVFEAYIAALVLSADTEEQGMVTAKNWAIALWEPVLDKATQQDKFYSTDIALTENNDNTDPRAKYNPDAKALLQKRILGGSHIKLAYEPWKASVELKGDKLGQNRHYIALYLTGYGHERKLLGKGEGKNKVEAGNWAAIEAMYGESKALVDECEQTASAEKTKRLAEKKGNDRQDKDATEDGHVVSKSDVVIKTEGPAIQSENTPIKEEDAPIKTQDPW